MDEKELQWFQSQKEITKQKLAEEQGKSYHSKQIAVVLLEKCRLHTESFASVEAIESPLKTMKNDKKQKHILRNEL